MASVDNITENMRFNKLITIERVSPKQWLCQCDCGNERRLFESRLKSGHHQSCGCLALKANGQWGSKTYQSWMDMKYRCYRKANTDFYLYGAIGVTVCERWLNDFRNFLADMGEAPPGCSIDRRDPRGNYEPSNCRWATTKEQARNKKTTRWIEFDGQTKSMAEWAEIYSLNYWSFRRRLDDGWLIRDAIFVPFSRNKPRRTKSA